MNEPFDLSKHLDKRQAAAYLRCSAATLDRYLKKITGVRTIKYLGKVYMEPHDLEALQRAIVEVRVR